MKIYLVLAVSLMSSVAMADPVKVQPLRFLGPDAPSRVFSRQILDRMEGNFSLANIKVEALRIKTHLNPFRQQVTLDNRLAAFRKAEGWLQRRGYDDPRVLKLALTGRADNIWLYGYANSTVCYIKRCNPFGLAAVAEVSPGGYPRVDHSVIAATHEVGHLLGATHIDEYPNIMHSSAMQYITPLTPTLTWDQQTVKVMQWVSR